jgi:L-lactate utilization protein LutB
MSLFKKFFGSNNPASEEEKEKEYNKSFSDMNMSIDEQFIYNFKKNGGKFLYCENTEEVKEQFENILEEKVKYYVMIQTYSAC